MIYLIVLFSINFSDGLSAYQKGEFQKARQLFSSFILANPRNSDVPRATLCLARLETNPIIARDSLYLRVVSVYSGTPYADSALYEAASIDYALAAYQNAASKFKQLLTLYPNTSLLPQTNYWLGICYLILGDKNAARVHFNEAKVRGVGTVWSNFASKEIKALPAVSSTPAGNNLAGSYAVQVGSFNDKSRAEALLAEYKKSGRSGEIKQVTVAGNVYYRVWLGPFSSDADARAYVKTLKAAGKAAMVVKR